MTCTVIFMSNLAIELYIKKHRASFDPFDRLRTGKLRTGGA
jgi:hypothetical protein